MAGRKIRVRWNDNLQRWTAWVRFPDGTKRKVERVDRADAEADLDDLLAQRALATDTLSPRRQRSATFGEVIEAWFAAGCPTVAPGKNARHARKKAQNTVQNVEYLVNGHIRPSLWKLRVDRTSLERLERVFSDMADAGYATSTIDHTWGYLNQACAYGLRRRMIKTNPTTEALLPEAKAPKVRKSFTIEQADLLIRVAIPQDSRPAMWLTGLMCGLRPGELSGLRWPYLEIDSDEPTLEVAERAHEVNHKYVGQAEPKTPRKGRIGLHPLVVAALQRHRWEMRLLGPYDPDGFVFCTRNGTTISISNLRRDFQRLCGRIGLEGVEWTTYELRHSFVSLVSDQLDDLCKVADLAGHASTRTTQGYRHSVRPALPHAVMAWNKLLSSSGDRPGQKEQVPSPDTARPADAAVG